MVIEMVKLILLWINYFLDNGEFTTTIITRLNITEITMDFKRQHRVEFGSYYQTHEENTPTNKILYLTKGGI